jgi:hypothetical protein
MFTEDQIPIANAESELQLNAPELNKMYGFCSSWILRSRNWCLFPMLRDDPTIFILKMGRLRCPTT